MDKKIANRNFQLIVLIILTCGYILSSCNNRDKPISGVIKEKKIISQPKTKNPVPEIQGSGDSLTLLIKKQHSQKNTFILNKLLVESKVIGAKDVIRVSPFTQTKGGRNFSKIWQYVPKDTWLCKTKNHNNYFVFSFDNQNQAAQNFKGLVDVFNKGIHTRSEKIMFECAEYFNYGGDSYFLYKCYIIEHFRKCSENEILENRNDSNLLKFMYPQMPKDTIFLHNRCGRLI